MALALSVDGTRALSCGNLDMRLWDVPTGRELIRWTRLQGSIQKMRISRDGRLGLTAGRCVCLWDLKTGEFRSLVGAFTQSPLHIAFAAGDTRVIGLDYTREVRVWNLTTGKELAGAMLPMWVDRVAISPDGRRILGGGQDGKLGLWEIPSD